MGLFKSFDGDLEGEYLESRVSEALLLTRWTLVFGGLLFLVLGFWDELIDPGSLADTWPIRLGAAIGFAGLVAVSWRARSILALEFVGVLAFVLATTAFGLIVAEVEGGYLAGVGGFLVVVGVVALQIRNRGVLLGLLVLLLTPIVLYVVTGASRTETVNLLIWLFGSAGFAYIGFVVLDATNRRAFVAEKALGEERDKVDRLVRRMVPEPIADRLKAGEQTISDRLEEATVLFADIVGFTRYAENHDPEHVVLMLNSLFSRFDALVSRQGVEKIKTLGDGYMAAGGVPVHQPDHAAAITLLAWSMRAEMASFNAEHNVDWHIRVGIHSGPLVGGVIGQDRYAYDLWGDTVNIASRLESTGIPDEIRLSDETANRLDDTFQFEALGAVPMKNREPVAAHRLTGVRT